MPAQVFGRPKQYALTSPSSLDNNPHVHLQPNTDQGAVETFVGTDGVNDIYFINTSDGLGPPDVLQNWDVAKT
jgi:hypothetical protein